MISSLMMGFTFMVEFRVVFCDSEDRSHRPKRIHKHVEYHEISWGLLTERFRGNGNYTVVTSEYLLRILLKLLMICVILFNFTFNDSVESKPLLNKNVINIFLRYLSRFFSRRRREYIAAPNTLLNY